MTNLFSFSDTKKDLERYGPSDINWHQQIIYMYAIYHSKLLEIYIKYMSTVLHELSFTVLTS